MRMGRKVKGAYFCTERCSRSICAGIAAASVTGSEQKLRVQAKAAGPSGAIAGHEIRLPDSVNPLLRKLEQLGDATNQQASPSIW